MLVNYIGPTDCMWSEPFFRDEFSTEMTRHDISWRPGTAWNDEADLVVCDSWAVRDTKTPLVIYDRIENCAVSEHVRLLVAKYDCKAIMKPMSYANLEDHNAGWVDALPVGREMGLQPNFTPPAIEQGVLDKVHVITAMPYSALNFQPVETNEKILDICFLGRGHYSNRYQPSQIHRRMAVEAMLRLPRHLQQVILYSHTTGPWVFRREDAWRVMLRSKIVLCPWGVAQNSIRDYEAVWAGCTTIVPGGSKILMDPTPHSYAMMCDVGFHNLADVVATAIDNYDFDAAKQRAVELFGLCSVGYLAALVSRLCKALQC